MAQSEAQASGERRLQTMRILWAVLLGNIGLFALIGYVTRQGSEFEPARETNFSTLLLIFFALGLSSVAASFAVKRVFLARAEREQNTAVMQTGLIISMVMCEVAALLGLIGLFIDGNPYAYGLFVIAALGDVLHFPRREQVLAASYKTVERSGGGIKI